MENAFKKLHYLELLYKCTSQKCLLLKTEQNRTGLTSTFAFNTPKDFLQTPEDYLKTPITTNAWVGVN